MPPDCGIAMRNRGGDGMTWRVDHRDRTLCGYQGSLMPRRAQTEANYILHTARLGPTGAAGSPGSNIGSTGAPSVRESDPAASPKLMLMKPQRRTAARRTKRYQQVGCDGRGGAGRQEPDAVDLFEAGPHRCPDIGGVIGHDPAGCGGVPGRKGLKHGLMIEDRLF